ncbi:MAG: DUF2279 domain-containing protein [Marinilabiliales bacterium]|nr:MAG: DUF2279 domain-containing protein [Marinilabiliales bacterium]
MKKKTHENIRLKELIILCLLLQTVCISGISAQNDSLNFIEKYKMPAFSSGVGIGYGITMTGLYNLWYKGYDQSSFHWFNDSNEWLQMDKIGHAYSSYYINSIAFNGFLWASENRKKSLLIASLSSWIMVSSIEFYDGLSAEWGASWSDLIANTSGILLYTGQECLFHDQFITPKYSFHPSAYAQFRPDALGSNLTTQFAKDYNGISYWFSVNLNKTTGVEFIPKWLCISIGYSATGMTGGPSNISSFKGNPIPDFERRRQFYLSLDIDWKSVPAEKKVTKLLFRGLNALKIPFPSLELSNGMLKAHMLYF